MLQLKKKLPQKEMYVGFSLIKIYSITFRVLLVITTAVFAFHSYVLVDRYLQHDVSLSITQIPQKALPMPIVSLQMDSYRNNHSGIKTPPAIMNLTLSLAQGENFPEWAKKEAHSQGQQYQDFVAANMINSCNQQNNFESDFKITADKKIWI